MGYSLHIEREGGGISLEEWIAAVEDIPEARIDSSAVEFVNPKTGEVMSFPGQAGDVAVLFPDDESGWSKCISFSQGRGSFRASAVTDRPGDPIRIVASKLAASLGAQIVGDEGEIYNWIVPAD